VRVQKGKSAAQVLKGGILQRMFQPAVIEPRRLLGLGVLRLLAVVVLLGGCTTPGTPVSKTPPTPVSKPAVTAAPVAILVSDQLAVYEQVADMLNARLTHTRTYVLDGDERKARAVIAKLHAKDQSSVVAIGSLAARVAPQLSEWPVVYCLDFTPATVRAHLSTMRGVQAAPPAFKQLQAWKMLDPRLRRITLITGRDRGEFVREAQAAARRLGIELDHLGVQSDRELLYAVKRLDSEVRGVWLAPDNRVLSAGVLREVLAYTLRQGKQTLVFNSQLLKYGALISVEADPQDIAERVLEQLRAPRSMPRVAPLQRARTVVNTEIAKQLGLAVPPAMKKGLYVF
jgi:putative tryptophan/tyrosine transport system substrate-binding protein